MLSRKIDDAKIRNNQKDLKYWTGMYSNSKNLVVYTKKVFSTTPSFIDILASEDSESIQHLWDLAIENTEIKEVNGNVQIQTGHQIPDKSFI